MPHTRTHRGAPPEDARLFCEDQWARLRAAVFDLSWLLERAYNPRSALEIVGNRYQISARQRIAVGRSACAESKRTQRLSRCVLSSSLRSRPLWIDGYNLLLTIEVALGGGVILGG